MKLLKNKEENLSLQIDVQQPHVPVRILACVASVLCVVSYLITMIGNDQFDTEVGPAGVVAAQALWNASQVAQLILILGLWCTHRHWWVYTISFVTIGLLPFSIYLISPGGFVFAATILATCILTMVCSVPNFNVRIVDSGVANKTSSLCKLEFLAFACKSGVLNVQLQCEPELLAALE